MADAHAGRIRCLLAVVAILGLSGAAAAAEPAVSFTRDIKGILSNRCVRCHGPDAEDRHGGGDDGLRLDTFEGATEDLGGHAAIVPGKPTESELIARITSTDPDVVMPPPAAGERLSPREVELLSRWIAAGGEYEPHWAYVPPVQPPVPTVKDTAWPKNDIDRFILARLEAEGLSPQPAADRVTLARRLAIDLTGLPPTPEEVDAFVADAAPAAVERFTERLLAHDGYGEHVAREWLDLARYADSAGYADDRPRTIWGWRDWVIRACDANMPFDEFTIRQLAGDLLPDATADDRIATAFHRNTLTNSEGGTIDEEFRVAAVVDRVNTTMSTWMGTTMACCQCHDHKYDPLSQREYFGIYAILKRIVRSMALPQPCPQAFPSR
jgi:mono/diheme cytochrome c family protein